MKILTKICLSLLFFVLAFFNYANASVVCPIEGCNDIEIEKYYIHTLDTESYIAIEPKTFDNGSGEDIETSFEPFFKNYFCTQKTECFCNNSALVVFTFKTEIHPNAP